ncbi:MAG: CAP domain-containing protein [Bacillota bacterium]|nr:CAP domain-containing protein [Bacillota bacterium]
MKRFAGALVSLILLFSVSAQASSCNLQSNGRSLFGGSSCSPVSCGSQATGNSSCNNTNSCTGSIPSNIYNILNGSAGTNTPCSSGNCETYCPSGNCDTSCPSGNCDTNTCPSGNCDTKTCLSGNCDTSCPTGTCDTNTCPTGTCNTSKVSDATSNAGSQKNCNVIMNLNTGSKTCPSAIIVNDRTMLPVRALAESLGAKVGWNNSQRKVTINRNGCGTISFCPGNNCISNGNSTVTTDCAPIIINDKTYAPIRVICELLGLNVNWDGKNVIVNQNPDDQNSNGSSNTSGDEITNGSSNTSDDNAATTEFAKEVLSLVNQQRANYGLKALSYSTKLEAVAYLHSEDMAKNNYFSHTSLAGQSPFDRLKDAGITYSIAEENIAAGQKTPQEVMDSWMNSEGHRANILNADVTEMGIGIYEGGSYGIYWTQMFIG